MSRILFLSNHFITLYSFRKELINKLIKAGHEVYISTPEDEQNTYFTDLGCRIVVTNMDRHGIDPLKDLKIIKAYRRIFKELKPDIIFSYTIKPNIYGALANRSGRYRQVCNITGTGGTFLKKGFVNTVATMLYKLSVKHAYKVFFQNTGDRDYFIEHGMIKDNYEMLPGSGVNLEQHKLSDMPADDHVNFIFIGRVMAIKGIDQYLECAENIKKKCPNTSFYIAGFVDDDNYKGIIEQKNKAGVIDYIGFQKNIDEWIEKCHCTILPSIGGEGVPNVLLESAAAGRACIGSDIPGTRTVIDEGTTGYLFEKGNGRALIEKVERFLKLSYDEKKQMGLAGRRKMEKEFDRQIVVDKYLAEVARTGVTSREVVL